MYRCDVCDAVQPPRQIKLKHIVYREDGSIAQEVPVCAVCQQQLKDGMPLRLLRKVKRPQRIVPALSTLALTPPARPVVPVAKPVALKIGTPIRTTGRFSHDQSKTSQPKSHTANQQRRPHAARGSRRDTAS